MPEKESLRSRLIGTWELIEYSGILAGESETIYPMGPDAKGILHYTESGYMSSHLLRPGQGQFERGGRSGNDEEWAQVGRNYIAYTGKFYLDEKGQEPVLMHRMDVANLPSMLGDQQRRLLSIKEEVGGMVLNLAPDGPSLAKMGYKEMQLSWRRLPDNLATSPPVSED